MNIFDELPYDEIEKYYDEVYRYSETSDYEFWSDDELERLERDIWEGIKKWRNENPQKHYIQKKKQ